MVNEGLKSVRDTINMRATTDNINNFIYLNKQNSVFKFALSFQILTKCVSMPEILFNNCIPKLILKRNKNEKKVIITNKITANIE